MTLYATLFWSIYKLLLVVKINMGFLFECLYFLLIYHMILWIECRYWVNVLRSFNIYILLTIHYFTVLALLLTIIGNKMSKNWWSIIWDIFMGSLIWELMLNERLRMLILWVLYLGRMELLSRMVIWWHCISIMDISRIQLHLVHLSLQLLLLGFILMNNSNLLLLTN